MCNEKCCNEITFWKPYRYSCWYHSNHNKFFKYITYKKYNYCKSINEQKYILCNILIVFIYKIINEIFYFFISLNKYDTTITITAPKIFNIMSSISNVWLGILVIKLMTIDRFYKQWHKKDKYNVFLAENSLI